jgi:phenylalanyl-tRNA synthetase beta chain
MRPTPLASIINIADENSKRGYGDLGIFELGPGFSGKNADDQIIIASGIRTGSYRLEGYGKDWQGFKSVDAFDAKKDVISVLEELGINNQKIKIKESAPKFYHPGRSGQILTEKGSIVANFGEIHPKIIKEKDFNTAVGFEIFLDCIDLLQEKKSTKNAPKIYNLQPLRRDFSFIVDNEVSAQTIIEAAKNSNNSLIKNVKIFDQFLNEENKSIEITIQPTDHTLTDHELEEISLKVINSVESATKGKLRS